MTEDAEFISAAILVWTGMGTHAWPLRRDSAVIDQYGVVTAAGLLPRIKQLAAEFDAGVADPRGNLAELGDAAAERFHARRPDISTKAVHALRWCYTFDHR